MLRKIISLILCFSFLFTQSGFAQGAAELNLGQYLGQMHSNLSIDKFRPLHLRYLSYDLTTDNFQLLLDKGDNPDIKDQELEDQTKVLMEYFQIGLALPNDKFWVNLRPDAQDQLIDPELEKTDLGKMMLEADLQLKRDTANWTSPQTTEGRLYWDKLYQKAKELFGKEPANIPTITRPWIVPGEIIVREGEASAYIFKANLKVMLEEDYLSSQPSAISSQQYNFKDPRMKELNTYSTQLIRELIIPKLTKEVNTAKRYAALRQVFFSLIMARWFKERFSQSQVTGHRSQENALVNLIDSRNLTNLTSKQAWSKTFYFNEYKKSFAKGEYNLKEQVNTPTGQVIRSYVSGGVLPMVDSPLKGRFRNKEGFLGPRTIFGNFFVFGGSGNKISDSPLSASDKRKTEESQQEFFQHIKTLTEKFSKFIQERSLPWWKTLIFFKFEKTWEGSLIKKHLPHLVELYNIIAGIQEKTLSWKLVDNIKGLIKASTKDKEAIKEKYSSVPYIDGLGMVWSTRPFGVLRVLRLYNQEIGPILEEYEKTLDKLVKEEVKKGSLPLAPGEILLLGLDKAAVLAALYNAAQPQGWGWLQYEHSLMTVEKARESLKNRTDFDYIKGRVLKVDLSSDYKFNPWLYDRDNGQGVAERIISELKASSSLAQALATDEWDPVEKEYGRNFVVEQLLGKFQELDPKSKATVSSALKKVVGGIDFTLFKTLYQPMGSFQGLKCTLPTLSSSALERIDLDKELASLRQMASSGLVPSGQRVKEYEAALFQKGRFEEKQDDLLVCLAEIYRLAEDEVLETSPELNESLLIADTGRFAILPNNQKVGLN